MFMNNIIHEMAPMVQLLYIHLLIRRLYSYEFTV